MALGTTHRQTQEDLTGCFHPIRDIVGEVFLRDRAAFVRDHVVAIETRRDQL